MSQPTNQNGVLVAPGTGALETHRDGALLKFSTDPLPHGHNY